MSVQVIYFDLGATLVTSPRQWLPGAKALVTSLRSKGVRLGIISNTGNLTTRAHILDILPTDFDINMFEAALVFFSSEVQLVKPHTEIFHRAVTATGIPAAQCLYCSEDIVESLVAQHVGMRSIRVQSAPNSDMSVLEQRIAEFQNVVD